MRADPSSNRQVMAEQMIPYPGKTHLRTEIASRDADAETLAYEAVDAARGGRSEASLFRPCFCRPQPRDFAERP